MTNSRGRGTNEKQIGFESMRQKNDAALLQCQVKNQTTLQEWYSGLAFRAENDKNHHERFHQVREQALQ